MIKKLLQEWVNHDGTYSLDLIIRSEDALVKSIVILTAEEAQYIYDHLEGNSPIQRDIFLKIIMAIPEIHRIKIKGCPF